MPPAPELLLVTGPPELLLVAPPLPPVPALLLLVVVVVVPSSLQPHAISVSPRASAPNTPALRIMFSLSSC
jgi:hypothetical protein